MKRDQEKKRLMKGLILIIGKDSLTVDGSELF